MMIRELKGKVEESLEASLDEIKAFVTDMSKIRFSLVGIDTWIINLHHYRSYIDIDRILQLLLISHG